ncbi:T9SS type A sorting domain-containing protein [Flavobacterium sp. NRK F10]|uniref:DUF7619 domain-containing protein n=1 Tax=Flavobacterium sp. NRK F10 TaxID=2954931 RepID=UPI002090D2B3|nr:T9SS type A sorting domain-containing protein [Flavobacterium sp. NRK F10]MCO6173577.1 T9SS type A sorting domain-containing protein [Flavobacterium sp. NRK F10]
MKKLYFLSFLLLNFLANAQIINFPDANLKAKLLSATAGTTSSNHVASTVADPGLWPTFFHKIDTNDNGEIEVSEAELITYLDISSANITDLTGLSYFSNLKTLICKYNQISNLDEVNTLSNLLLFHLYYNSNSNLTQVNLNNLVNLTKLHCFGSGISELIVSSNVSLTALDCMGNQLTTLDVSNCPNLNYLRCANNSSSLEYLNLKNGNTQDWITLDIYGLQNLKYVCADEEDIALVQSKINNLPNCHVNTYCSFTPGGTFYEISGNVKFDYDDNGCDNLDFSYSNLSFDITDGVTPSIFIANQTGEYYIPVGNSSLIITPNLENPTYFNITPPSFTVDFPTQPSPFTQDFCVTANGVYSDVEVMIVPINPARPGFDANYKLVFKNKGNQVENGTVSLTFDNTVLDYVSSNLVYDSSVTNSFTWNYTNLQPFEIREIEIAFNVNSPIETPAVNNGDVLNYTATITTANTDETIEDNSFTLNQTVVGSYDPNDKTCLEGEVVGPSMIGKYIHYVIRFENTGTYAAQNIVVKDMIDASKFDLSSLVPLHSSHDFYTRIKNNKVEFIFENINLDFNDSTNDGYVAFKIKTLPTLNIGDTFSNEANIYFDYNFPITTNNYVTTIQALSNPSFEFGDEFTLYPNPVKDILNISSKNQTEIKSVEIYNIIGQLVIVVPNAVQNIDVSSLESGTYFVKVNSEKGSGNTKFIKE